MGEEDPGFHDHNNYTKCELRCVMKISLLTDSVYVFVVCSQNGCG